MSNKPSLKERIKKAFRSALYIKNHFDGYRGIDAKLKDIQSEISKCCGTLETLEDLLDREHPITNVPKQSQDYCDVIIQMEKTLYTLYHERSRTIFARGRTYLHLLATHESMQSSFKTLKKLQAEIQLSLNMETLNRVGAIRRDNQATRHNLGAVHKTMQAVESNLSTVSDDTGMILGDVGVIRGDLRQARRNMYAVRAKFEPMAGDMGTLEKEILAIGDDIDEIAECTMTIEDVTCLIPKRMMAMEDDLRSIKAAMTELLRRVPQTSTPVTHLPPILQANAAPQLNTTTTQQAPAHLRAPAHL
jgi:chromosome segregation ATPase